MSRRDISPLMAGDVVDSRSTNGLAFRIRRFWTLPGADRRLLILIAIVVPITEIGLRVAGYRHMTSILRRFALRQRPVENQELEVERYRRLVFAFHLQFPFAGRCLARALTLWCLLNRRGIATVLRFGIRKDGERLAAHAWVEFKNQPLTIDRDVTRLYIVPDWPVGPSGKVSPIKI